MGRESDAAATLFPLPEKPATYPVEYGKRAGELIARGAPPLSPRKRTIATRWRGRELYGRKRAGAASMSPYSIDDPKHWLDRAKEARALVGR